MKKIIVLACVTLLLSSAAMPAWTPRVQPTALTAREASRHTPWPHAYLETLVVDRAATPTAADV